MEVQPYLYINHVISPISSYTKVEVCKTSPVIRFQAIKRNLKAQQNIVLDFYKEFINLYKT